MRRSGAETLNSQQGEIINTPSLIACQWNLR
jgi:hypothetical protein